MYLWCYSILKYGREKLIKIIDFLEKMWKNVKRVFGFLNRLCKFYKRQGLWNFYLYSDIRINGSSVNIIYADRKINRIIPFY